MITKIKTIIIHYPHEQIVSSSRLHNFEPMSVVNCLAVSLKVAIAVNY